VEKIRTKGGNIMGDSFLNFLEKLHGEEITIKPTISTQEPARRKPAPVVEEMEEEIEPVRQEPVRAKQQPQQPKADTINEEFMDKVYDYAQSVIKVAKNNFQKEQRRVVLESIVRNINTYLADFYGAPASAAPVRHHQPAAASSPMFNTNTTMSESEWNSMPTVFEGDSAPAPARRPSMTERIGGTDYSTSLNLGVKVNHNGEREVDISQVSEKEILEMKVLAGLVTTGGKPIEQVAMSSVSKTAGAPALVIEGGESAYNTEAMDD
jgi:hypothetical protein